MSRPLIALTPSFDPQTNKQNVYMRYIRAIEQAGGAPFLLPLTTDRTVLRQFLDLADGVLFTGGDDIHPRLYGRTLHEKCGELCPERDEMEFALGEEFLKTEKPFLGICRGIQFLNVLYGGDLWQDLPSEYGYKSIHNQGGNYDKHFHNVTPVKGGMLARVVGSDESFGVNTAHHQAVKTLASGLILEAVSDDGVIEAFSSTDRTFGLAVQWHPEYLVGYDKNAQVLFSSFVDAAKK